MEKLERGVFAVDGAGFPGYHNPAEDWNGFSVPYFTREAAEGIAAYWARQADTHPDYGVQTASYDVARDCYVLHNGDEAIDCDAGMAVETVDGLLVLYGVGTGYWAWSEVENTTED